MTAPREAGDVLMLGDSLIEYFDWEGRFPHHRIRNLGVSGEPVEWLLERLDLIISEYPAAEAAFIMSGINNLAMEQSGFIGDYRKIIRKLQTAYPAMRVHIHTLLPTLLHWIDAAEVVRVNALIVKLAAETGVVLIDMHDLFLERGLRELLSDDGIHLSARGYELWAGVISPRIEPR